MGKGNYVQTNFRSGEITPRLHYAFGDERVRQGVKTLNNFIIYQQGGITKRSQTSFVAPVKDSSKTTRLINFEFNKDSSNIYVIELGDTYARFYKNNAQIRESAKTITNITQANPGVVTAGTHGYSNGDHVYISGVTGMTEVNGRWFQVANKTSTTFELNDLTGSNIDTSSYTAYSSAGTSEKVYEITTPWDETEIDAVQFVQSADVVYMVHPDYAPRELSRTGDTSWSIADLTDYAGSGNSFTDGPYLDENTTGTTLTPSGTSGSVTWTASAITGINNDTGFQSTDVGRIFRWQDAGSTWHWVYITARASTTSITGTIVDTTLSAAGARSTWRLGSWSDTDGWPGVVAFYENRLVFGATDALPDTLWGSNNTSYLDFTPGNAAADPYTFTLSLSGQINRIVWLDPQRKLRIGTLGYVASLDDPTTDVSAKIESSVSCADIVPHKIDTTTVFVQRGSNKVRVLQAGQFSDDNLTAVEADILSEHITKQGIVSSAYQEVPHSTVWYEMTDGTLAAFTHNKLENIYAWHTHSIGGTSAAVKSLTSIPTSTNSQLWAIVSRTINGGTHQYIEYLEDDFSGTDATIGTTTKFLDSGISVTNSPASATVSGLWHLEGETVTVVADGYIAKSSGSEDITVTNGTITLDETASNIEVGYKYTAEVDLLPIDFGSNLGSATGSKARTRDIIIKLADTIGGEIGFDSSNTQTVTFRKPGDNMNEAVPLFTGEKRVDGGPWGSEASAYIKQTQPLPMTIYAVTAKIEVNDN
jgi:hypothetical protein